MQTNKLSDAEYEDLKRFFIRYVDWFIPAHQKSENPAHQPMIFLDNLERKSVSLAKKGLQMAVNDMVEMTTDWSPEQVAAADAKFATQGALTLSEIRRRYSKKYLQTLKRGEIRSATEYYLLKGILDGGGIEAGATEGRQIEVMLAEFENKIKHQSVKK